MAHSWTARLAFALAASQYLFATVSAQIASAITPSLVSSVASASSTPTQSSGPQVHLIKAGAGGFKFTPQSVSNVSVGDIITFEFYPPDHSVARAEFGSACVPYEYTGMDKVGFWSTTQWVNTTEELTHWNLTINSTEPIFFYCAAPQSCIEKHMVGVINPNDTQTLDAQIQSAETADFQVAPGQPIPSEATSTTFVNAPTATPSTSTSSAPTPAPSGGSHKLSGGAIAGIVIGAIAFLAICAALFYFVGRSKSLKEVLKRQDATVKPNQPDTHQSMTTYGAGGLASPGFSQNQSSGFPSPTPYSSPNDGYGFNSPPQYGQHYATDQHPSGWASPPPQHMSYMSDGSLSQQQMNEMKYASSGVQPAIAELQSPTPGTQEWVGELDASQKGRK